MGGSGAIQIIRCSKRLCAGVGGNSRQKLLPGAVIGGEDYQCAVITIAQLANLVHDVSDTCVELRQKGFPAFSLTYDVILCAAARISPSRIGSLDGASDPANPGIVNN
jgi:hypothetical protein